MNIIYLQCDVRFNQWMLEKIGDKYVVEYTIERCRRIYDIKIMAGVYDCPENMKLVEVLKEKGVIVKITAEEDVNKRFLHIVTKEEADYVVRVGGDQCLLDTDNINNIIAEMGLASSEWFFEWNCSCILPDIVSVNCLRKWKKEIEESNRYFKVLENLPDINRYRLPYPMLVLYNFRANSNEGFRICKNVILNHLNVYDLSEKILPRIINSKYLTKSGLLGSWIIPADIGEFYYDEDKKVNPWLGKSVIDLIKKHLNESLSVFEWGCGNSTLFWSQYVRDVVAVEHNKQWYEKMLQAVPDNVLIKYCELEYGKEYCSSILEENKTFDIVLIDGRDRVRCAQNAVLKLKENGIIIWDDSERENYRPGYAFLKENGFKQLELSSIAYGLPGAEQFTSIFYRTNNLCGI